MILPGYINPTENKMNMIMYIHNHAHDLSDEQINECLGHLSEYNAEIDTYKNVYYAHEAADKVKNTLERRYFSEEMLNKYEMGLNLEKFTQATLNSIATIELVNDNKEYLDATFERLKENSGNTHLNLVLNDYQYKINNNWESFLTDTFGNIYNSFAKKGIKKLVEDEIKDETFYSASTSYGSISQATNSVLAEAQWVLLAADAGGFFAQISMNTKDILSNAIEVKYLWFIENEVRTLLKKDLYEYQSNQTEENAKKVIDDLYLLKSTKLRAITVTKDIYDAAGSNWVSKIPGTNLSSLSENITDLYNNQSDALINASISETEYTDETLTLENGESLLIENDHEVNGAIYDGAIKTDGSVKNITNASGRVAGGVILNENSVLTVNCTDKIVYIPYIVLNGSSSIIISNNAKLQIGELYVQGNCTIAGDGTMEIIKDAQITSSKTLTCNSDINIKGDLDIAYQASLSVSKTIEVDGNLINEGWSALTLNNGQIIVGGNYSNSGILSMTHDDDYLCIGGNFTDGFKSDKLTAGCFEIKGDMTDCGTYKPSGTHKTILSGDKAQSIDLYGSSYDGSTTGYFNILEITNTSEEGVTFKSTIDVHSVITQSTGAKLNNTSYVKLQNKSAFVDYGTELNDKINAYVGNALGVIPTWLDHDLYIEHITPQMESMEADGVLYDEYEGTPVKAYNATIDLSESDTISGIKWVITDLNGRTAEHDAKTVNLSGSGSVSIGLIISGTSDQLSTISKVEAVAGE